MRYMVKGCLFLLLLLASYAFTDELRYKETKKVMAHDGWNRWLQMNQQGTMKIRVSSSEPFGITLLNDLGYSAISLGDREIQEEDIVYTTDCQDSVCEKDIFLAKGRYYLMLESQSDIDAEMRLEIYRVKE